MTATKSLDPGAALRDRLLSAFAKLKLPTSPALATRILALAEDPDASMDQFAEAIQLDAALAGRLLKMANSAQFGQRNVVTTIPRAVQVLGVTRVRTVALGFQLVSHLNKLGGVKFDIKTHWQHSALRGCLMRQIASRVAPSMKEEAFLVGLLHDCGVLLLVQMQGKEYVDLYDSHRLSPAAFYEAEKNRFEFNHVEAAAVMASEWKLPEEIATPLASHHSGASLPADPTDLHKLCAVSYLVGSMRFVSSEGPDPGDAELRRFAQGQLALADSDLAGHFAAAVDEYKHMAEILGDSLPEDLDITDLLSEANRQLMTVAGEAANEIGAATAERDKVQRQQEQLKHALGEYRERAARDPLTRVLNRGALFETAGRMADAARRENQDVTLAFLDLDHFKKLNDTYGHKTGDQVLCAVARAVGGVVSNSGCVGRYGGEEFVLVLTGQTRQQAARTGEEIVRTVRSIKYAELGLRAPITCSVGVIWARGADCTSVEALMAAADEQMYIAKKKGRDRSCCKPPASATSADSHPRPDVARVIAQALGAGQPAVPQRAGSRHLRAVASRLNRLAPSRFVSNRKQSRKELLARCFISALKLPDCKVETAEGFVRNISTTGLGLLSTRFLGRGEPVEISICGAGAALVYVAGLVTFCRHVEGDVHEVGVQFTAHAREPIFSKDPAAAMKDCAWLAQAIQELQTRARTPDEPAPS